MTERKFCNGCPDVQIKETQRGIKVTCLGKRFPHMKGAFIAWVGIYAICDRKHLLRLELCKECECAYKKTKNAKKSKKAIGKKCGGR